MTDNDICRNCKNKKGEITKEYCTSNPVKVSSIMNKLNSFKKKNHKRWGVYQQSGVTRINDSDYKFIIKKSK